ncbi:MAG: ferrochelatase [Planctomycetota bacterium]
MKRVGVLLLQMGGPRSLEEVEPYIQTLFADPNLVRLPAPISWFRGPLSRLVAKRRAPEVREQYAKIGGGSPNNDTTIAQAAALAEALRDDGDFRCYAAMAYTPPTILEAMQQGQEDGVTDWIALSMFPQFSTASTGASFADLEKACAEVGVASSSVTRISRWGGREDYLDAIAAMTLATLEEAKAAHPMKPHLVLSAHGLPVSYVKSGDPYVEEVEESVAGLRARLPQDQQTTLAYQSRATPVKWVEPATIDTLKRLGQEGEKNLVVLPLSFVNDHIETLFEIDMMLRDDAIAAGVEHYTRVPVFNVDARLTAILRSLVLEEGGLPSKES